MDRLTKEEFPSLKACDKCIEFDECHQKQCVKVYDALLRLKHYEGLESQLQEVYGECDGLLEESVKYLAEHSGIELDKPSKARLLTDGSVDKWLRWKELDEKGRLFEKPCNIGDTLYEPRPDRGIISEYTVQSITDFGNDVFIGWELNSGIYSNFKGVSSRKIGNSVFLTEEEAKKVLEGMGNDRKRSIKKHK